MFCLFIFEMGTDIYLYSLIIFITAFIGGLICFTGKWSDELLHMFISFGAGIFIGTVFLHLLPEALGHSKSFISAIFVLTGFMLIFFIERFLFIKGNGGYDQNHTVISITALVGLSIHSIIEGMGLAVGTQFESLGSVIFISILAHKTTAAFSLASLFLLAKYSIKKRMWLLILFSLMTPLGALLFSKFLINPDVHVLAPLLGLTTGTFLYVSVGELLPEVFHTKEKRWVKLFLLIVGILIMGLLSSAH